MNFSNDLMLYKVLPKYIEALRNIENGGDESVYMVNDGKENRPFIGIITLCNSYNYFIPLTTTKERFKYLTSREPDFTPIYKKGKLIAGIEFNKMIPVPLNQIRPLDLEIRRHDNNKTRENKMIRMYEYEWCNNHKNQIIHKAQHLYDMYINKDASYKNIKYCVDFIRLEVICRQYEIKCPPQYNKIK